MLVDNMPADVLALTTTIVRPEATDALPPCPAAAQRARPPSAGHASLLEGAAGTAIQCDEGGGDHGRDRTEPPSVDDRGPDLPPEVWTPKGSKDVRWHGIEPVILGKDSGTAAPIRVASAAVSRTARGSTGRGRQRVQPPTCLAVESVASGRVTRPAPPLLDTQVVNKRHRAGALAGGEKGVLGVGVVSDHGRRSSGAYGRCGEGKARVTLTLHLRCLERLGGGALVRGDNDPSSSRACGAERHRRGGRRRRLLRLPSRTIGPSALVPSTTSRVEVVVHVVQTLPADAAEDGLAVLLIASPVKTVLDV
mmetsp:Transcript_25126/g.73658  ORF Transcript_25126/g.73658 Transcript_25126/m.73658 type:complete len:308 (+) Transcript_25126:1187-2110(+)